MKHICFLLCCLFTLSLSLGVNSLAATSDQLTSGQVKQVQQIVHDYLLDNPQVLVEVSQKLQAQQAQEETVETKKAIMANAKVIFDAAASPIAGNTKGDVTLVEFFDYRCPHCKDMAPVMKQLIKSDKNLRVIYKDLPIFGGVSTYAAKATLASQKQGKYLAFHEALMAANDVLTQREVLDIAKKISLNVDQLQKDMNDQSIDDQIKDNFKLAQTLHIPATPAFVLGNRSGSAFDFILGEVPVATLQKSISTLR